MLTGDFNIQAHDMNPILTKRLLKENPAFAPVFKDLSFEYRIMTELLTSNSKYSILDMLKLDQKDHYYNLCTFGDYYINEKEEQVPLDTVLSVKDEWCSK